MLVFPGVVLIVDRPAWGADHAVISVGDRTVLTRNVTLSAASGITIGADVTIGSFSSVIDNDHQHLEAHPSVFYAPSVSDSISIGDGTWIAERCAILRGSSIGRHCTIGANSVVRGAIPDYAIAVGSPARVVGSNRGAVRPSTTF